MSKRNLVVPAAATAKRNVRAAAGGGQSLEVSRAYANKHMFARRTGQLCDRVVAARDCRRRH